MTQPNEGLAASVQISAGPHAPEEEVDKLTRQLLKQVRESGIPAELASLPGQSGSKAGEFLLIGKLLMHIAPGAVPFVSGIFKEWLSKDKDREVSLELPNGVKFDLKGSMPIGDIERLVSSLNAVGSQPKTAI